MPDNNTNTHDDNVVSTVSNSFERQVGLRPQGRAVTLVGNTLQAPINEAMNPNATSSSDIAVAAQPVAIRNSRGT